MKRSVLFMLLFLLLVFAVSCGDKNESKNDNESTNDENVQSDDDSSTGDDSQSDDDSVGPGKYKIAGYVQKGPFAQGSEITIAEIDSELVPIGTSYTTSTIDDFGSFEIS
ncbi:MAG TPA: hypothetical protein P5044_10785, partial [bacterium]|nr:hypothetical protein [bacterium]